MGANHFRAVRAVAVVGPSQGFPAGDLTAKARPTGVAVKLVLAGEQRLTASGADIGPILVELPILPGVGSLRPGFEENEICRLGQQLFPLRVGLRCSKRLIRFRLDEPINGPRNRQREQAKAKKYKRI